MSTLYAVPAAGTFRTASDQVNLLTVATIASKVAYTETTNDVSTVGWEYATFSIAYTKGDETGLRAKVQLYDGTAWQDALYKATQSASYSEVTSDLLNFAATTSGALPPVPVVGFQKARMAFVANGGTPTGTVGCKVTLGCTVKPGA